MTHLWQASVGFRDSERFRFECASCGDEHVGIPSFGWEYPVQYFALSESERDGRAVLSDDTCVIDDQWYFIRGCLEVPVHGYEEPLNYGVWLSLSRWSFTRYAELFEDVGRAAGEQFFGWLCTAIPGYPDTQLLKTMISVRAWPTRPYVGLEPNDHPLAVEQREGVSEQRVQQLVERILHAK